MTPDHSREAIELAKTLSRNNDEALLNAVDDDIWLIEALALLKSPWLAAHDAALVEGRDAEIEATQRRWEDWLFATNWPFDWTTPANQPPTTAERMGRIWNERDNWLITDDEAADCIADESGLASTEADS